jgi:hypothetical protein
MSLAPILYWVGLCLFLFRISTENPISMLGPSEFVSYSRSNDQHESISLIKLRNKAYNQFKSDIISATILHPTVQAMLMISDAAAAKVRYYQLSSFIMTLTKFIFNRRSPQTERYSQSLSRHTNQSRSLVQILSQLS